MYVAMYACMYVCNYANVCASKGVFTKSFHTESRLMQCVTLIEQSVIWSKPCFSDFCENDA